MSKTKVKANLVDLRHSPTKLVINGVEVDQASESAPWVADMLKGGSVDSSSKVQYYLDAMQVDMDLTKRGSDNNAQTVTITVVSDNPRLADSPHAKLLAQEFLERQGYTKPFFKRVSTVMSYDPEAEKPTDRMKLAPGLKSATGKFAANLTFIV